MSVARVAALAALGIAVVLVAVLLLRGDGGTEYTVRLINAGQLVNGDDVQVGGRRIGSIEDIRLTDNNHAAIKVKVEEDYAPLHEGTTAVVRATSLSGVANRYIQLFPGPDSSRALGAGATLGTEKTTSIVDLDQLFDTFGPKTRKGLQKVVQGFATQYGGKSAEANEAIKYFNPAISTTDQLVQELLGDQPTLQRFLVDTSSLVTAIAERRNDLADLVGNASETAAAIGNERTALTQTLDLLPETLRKGNTTFVNLRATLDDVTELVDASKPVAPELAPFFRTLRPLLVESRPTIRDLSLLIRKPGPDNDSIDLLNEAPALAQVAAPTFANTRRALQQSMPVVEFIRPYAPELIGWFRDFGQSGSTYDANGHYARIQPIFNAFSFTDNPAGGTLTPILSSQRLAGYDVGFARCPGSATQPAVDGSNPFLDGGNLGPNDCDPNFVPPGP
jgi:phospholipid/cholesterol/gamma-HCH transport system substrate-binding protein